MLEDYYALLGIPRSANDAAIRSSYRRLALLTHPDKNRGNPTATRRFQQVCLMTPYETLKDPSKRKVYDTQWAGTAQSSSTTSATNDSFSNNTTASESFWGKPDSPSTQQIVELEKKLQELKDRELSLRSERDPLLPILIGMRKVMERFAAESDEDDEQENAAKSWFAYFFKRENSEEIIQGIKRRRTERATGRLVLEARRSSLNLRYRALEKDIQENTAAMATLTRQITDARYAEAQRERAERARRYNEELRTNHQRAEEQRTKEQEELRKAGTKRDEEQKRQGEAGNRPRAHAWNQWQPGHDHPKPDSRHQQTKKNAQEGRKPATGFAESFCDHREWWSEVIGRHECSRCHIFMAKTQLKGGRQQKHRA
ncbi:hypothetical protein TruAng_009283 [Truncatella angustata]|nr:hypothetical protein TruAng_009283 [Truncatella angustata]